MTYSNLTQSMQNIVSYNHDYMMKALFILIFFSVSLIYLFYYKPNFEKKTGLWSVMVLRIFVTAFSFFGLVLFPFILLTLQPSFTFAEFFDIYGIIYLAMFGLIMFVIILDFVRWGFILILNMAGVDINSEAYHNFKRFYKRYIQK
jgi:hypothetical protein